ncbi:YidB family protein [Methylobacterium tardum]|uniref:YidB family protein n=1 Tax=Methylobacterium tardum TaxID=374432 RepID=UPI00361582C6
MGLLDGAKNLIGDVAAAADRILEQTGSGKLALTMAKFYPGGLTAFLDRLRETGHGDAVASWLAAGAGPEARQPVPAAAIASCLPEGSRSVSPMTWVCRRAAWPSSCRNSCRPPWRSRVRTGS